MFRSLYILIGLLLSPVLMASTAQDEIYKDIAAIISNIPRESVEATKSQIWITGQICKQHEQMIKANQMALEKIDVGDAQSLAAAGINLMCTLSAEAKKAIDVPLSSFNQYLHPSVQLKNGIYTGDQKLGAWECKAESPLSSEKITLLGIFNENETISWKKLNSKSVQFWVAPYKINSSDVMTFQFDRVNDSWKISQICYFARI